MRDDREAVRDDRKAVRDVERRMTRRYAYIAIWTRNPTSKRRKTQANVPVVSHYGVKDTNTGTFDRIGHLNLQKAMCRYRYVYSRVNVLTNFSVVEESITIKKLTLIYGQLKIYRVADQAKRRLVTTSEPAEDCYDLLLYLKMADEGNPNDLANLLAHERGMRELMETRIARQEDNVSQMLQLLQMHVTQYNRDREPTVQVEMEADSVNRQETTLSNPPVALIAPAVPVMAASVAPAVMPNTEE
ncbi:hypothetical protein Syun_018581 [Stephania yunnanensis]|uniref:Uncharacterized protein n=1 Tax=Stephania yunnanensis TaxID=152371 RepID=A0AAP0ISM6_9MAGN